MSKHDAGLLLPTTACPDWAERLKRRQAPMSVGRLPMRTKRAERLSWVFRQLRLADVEGMPEVGTLGNHVWVDQIGRALWGGDEIREALVLTAKKQSKTSMASLLCCAAFLAFDVPNHPYTLLGPTVGSADFAFEQIVGALRADPELEALVMIRDYAREVEHRRTGSILRVKPASLGAVTGLKGSVFVDELHVFGAMNNGQKLRQQLKGALAASPHARGLYVTTHSDVPPQGLFRTMLSYARDVRDGRILDPAFLPVTYEPWPGCDPWEDETVWPLILPSYPHISGPEFYRSVISEANAGGPKMIAEAKSQFFNIEIGTSEGVSEWGVAKAVRSLQRDFDLAELLEKSDRVAVGIDLGGEGDLAALVVVGQAEGGGPMRAWARAWLTPNGYEANARAAKPILDELVDAGELELVESGEDVDAMLGLCETVRETGKLVGVGVDPAGAADLADALEGAGFVMDEPGGIFGVGQTSFRLAPAVRTLERRVEQKRFLFARQRLISWAFDNVRKGQKGNAPSIEKAMAVGRIDPVMALLDAVTVLITQKGEAFDASNMVG